MKKFLSLVLALVMTMSLVTIGAGAKDFTDAADITYKEAVEVMTAVKVVDGDTDGSFRPTDTLTRGAAAKIICNLILGPTTAAALKADSAPYPDVAANSTFAGYIAYCKQQGIISGYADGTFKPANTLTGYAFMKMLLGALGYDASVEGYNVPNWSIAVAKRALNVGLNDGLVGDFDGTAAVTREEALLYAFNAMQATMVEYDTTIKIGDVTVAGSKAAPVENWTKTDGNIADDYEMQFAEKYFTNLKAVATFDGMNRPSTEWMLKKESIGLYADEADYTVFVKADTDEDELPEVIAEISKKLEWEDCAEIYVNGKDGDALELVDMAGNQVEIYLNADDVNVIDYIIITHWTVAQLTADPEITEVDDKTYVEITAASLVEYEEDVFGYEGLKEDDVVMFYEDANGDWFFQKAESFVGTMTETTESEKVGSVTTPATYTVAGDKYYLSEQTSTIEQENLVTFEGLDNVTYYLDNDGNIIFAEGEAAPTDLMLVLDNDTYAATTFANYKQSQVLFVDETALVDLVKVYKVGGTEVDNTNVAALLEAYSLDEGGNNANKNAAKLFTYKNTAKGYELTPVARTAMNTNIFAGLPTTFKEGYKDAKCITNSETVYLVRDVDTYTGSAVTNTWKDSFTAYTGYKAVPTITNAHCIYYAKNGIAEYVVVDQFATIENIADDLFYAISDDVTAVYKANSNEVAYYYITGIYDGKIVNLKLNATAAATVGSDFTNTLFQVTKYDADGYVDTIVALDDATKYWVGMEGTKAAKADTLVLDTAASGTDTAFSYTDDTVVYTVNNKVLTVGGVDKIATDANDLVSVVTKGGDRDDASSREAVTIYIQKVAPTAPALPTEPVVPAEPTYADYLQNKLDIDTEAKTFTYYMDPAPMSVVQKMTKQDVADILAGFGFTNIKCVNDKWSFEKGIEFYENLDDVGVTPIVFG